jgi:ketosteroid isomerase-like protein
MGKIYWQRCARSIRSVGCNMEKGGEHHEVDTAAITDQLKASEASWLAEYNAKDADKLAGHYAADGSIANPGSALVTDEAGRRAAIDGMVNDPAFKLDFASDSVRVAKSGDLATTRGHFTMTYTDPATKKPANGAGNYLTVWQKQDDGSWKAVEDFITPGPAAETPAAAKD